MKDKHEKVTMELTKGEAVGIIMARIEDNWRHDFMPIIIMAPGVIIAYFIYELLNRVLNHWASLAFTIPVVVVAFILLWKWYKKAEKKALVQYEIMKETGANKHR